MPWFHCQPWANSCFCPAGRLGLAIHRDIGKTGQFCVPCREDRPPGCRPAESVRRPAGRRGTQLRGHVSWSACCRLLCESGALLRLRVTVTSRRWRHCRKWVLVSASASLVQVKGHPVYLRLLQVAVRSSALLCCKPMLPAGTGGTVAGKWQAATACFDSRPASQERAASRQAGAGSCR